MSIGLILSAAAVFGASGLPGLFLDRRGSRLSEKLAVVLMVGGSVLGIVGIGLSLASGGSAPLALAWSIPWGSFSVKVDGISVAFLLPVLVISASGAVYGLGYWSQADHPETAPKLRFFFGLLAASLVMLIVAHDAILFLMAWEVMALSGYFLITTEDHDPAVGQAGWIYLVATHLAALLLMAMFAMMHRVTGSFNIDPIAAGVVGGGTLTAIFLLALVGFGLKAGIMPLHLWLPGAHANAPSHVSAMLSGLVLKMGIYGLVRVTGLLPDPPVFWGALLLILGVVSGILGVAFAIGQHDVKRLLAYHSIENIGIMVMGLGLAMIGESLHRPDWIALGLGGALLHVWNHGLFKSLLFFSAGSIVHATHTREIDRLGGLAAKMPRTAMFFLIGAVAICGLPPLNGFVSELLIYLGLFQTMGIGAGQSYIGAAFAIPALAMIGALAVACFVKVFGAAFLGAARTETARQAHESPASMIGPMALLAACCLLIGLVPALVMPILDRAVTAWMPGHASVGPRLATLVPVGWISVMGVALIVMAGGGYVALRRVMQRADFRTVGTWDCGYAAPTARMQYTASSFGQILVELFGWALRPHVGRPKIDGVFPKTARFESHVDDVVLDEAVLPTVRWAERVLSWFRFLQQGRIQLYILYVFLILVVLLLWIVPLRNLFSFSTAP